jgi:hypothetical protein
MGGGDWVDGGGGKCTIEVLAEVLDEILDGDLAQHGLTSNV